MTKIDIGWVDPGYVSGHFAHSIAHQVADMQYFEAMGKVHASIGSSLITLARNMVTTEFLKGDSEWLWWVDSDMVFDKGHWLKLLTMAEDTGADMVTGLAFIFMQPSGVLIPSVFYDLETEGITMKAKIPENGQEISACGMASVLINRRVFEGLEPPRHSDYRWFDQVTQPDGSLSGEDTQFFVRARRAGYTLRICTEAETKHVKEVGLGRKDFEAQMGEANEMA